MSDHFAETAHGSKSVYFEDHWVDVSHIARPWWMLPVFAVITIPIWPLLLIGWFARFIIMALEYFLSMMEWLFADSALFRTVEAWGNKMEAAYYRSLLRKRGYSKPVITTKKTNWQEMSAEEATSFYRGPTH